MMATEEDRRAYREKIRRHIVSGHMGAMTLAAIVNVIDLAGDLATLEPGSTSREWFERQITTDIKVIEAAAGMNMDVEVTPRGSD